MHNLGTKASRILEASRKQIAGLLGVKSDEIIFTSGGTEGDNWVLKGVAFEKERYGKHIIVSDIEHPAVKESAKWLGEHGFEVSYAPVDEKGFVYVDKLAELCAQTQHLCQSWLLTMKSALFSQLKLSQNY